MAAVTTRLRVGHHIFVLVELAPVADRFAHPEQLHHVEHLVHAPAAPVELLTDGDVAILPRPAEPIRLIGSGHTDVALKRVGRRCDGWLGATRFAPGELEAILERIDAAREEAGRLDRPFDVMISVSKRHHARDAVAEVAAEGVTDIISAPWTIVPTEDPASLAGKVRAMDDFAAKLF